MKINSNFNCSLQSRDVSNYMAPSRGMSWSVMALVALYVAQDMPQG
jgi:hypothetical protein